MTLDELKAELDQSLRPPSFREALIQLNDGRVEQALSPVLLDAYGPYIQDAPVPSLLTHEKKLMRLYNSYHSQTKPDKLPAVVDTMAKTIQEWVARQPEAQRPTHLVMCGVSGQSVGWPVACKIGLPGLVVRKPSERSHSGQLVSGGGELGNYVIIDDFISAGDTIRGVIAQIGRRAMERMGRTAGPIDWNLVPRCVGIFLFSSVRRDAFHPNAAGASIAGGFIESNNMPPYAVPIMAQKACEACSDDD